MKAKPRASSRTSRGSTTSPKPRSDPASPSREKPNSSLPAKPWKASKPTASSQIPLTPGSRSPRNLSLLPHQSENVLVPIKGTLIVWRGVIKILDLLALQGISYEFYQTQQDQTHEKPR